MPFAFKLSRRMSRIRNALSVLAFTFIFMQCEAVPSSEPIGPNGSEQSRIVPASVTDLTASDPSDSSVTLSFTEVDDGTKHPANYEIRYGIAGVTPANTVSITSSDCPSPIKGNAIGARRTCVVEGLAESTNYEFQALPYRGTLDAGATLGTLSAVATTTTLASVSMVTMSASSVTVAVGQTIQLSASTLDRNGNGLSNRSVTWSSSDSTIATVDNKGLVTGVSKGGAVIRAKAKRAVGQTQVAVIVPVASVSLSPTPMSLTVGQSGRFTATLRDANGNVLTGQAVTWSSSASGVARVDSTGSVFGASAGNATVTATSGGSNAQSQVTVAAVSPALVATVTLAPSSANLTVGQTSQLSVTLKDANGNVLTGRTVTWSSNATGVASVNTSGLVTTVAAGSATITATSEGRTGTAQFTITAPSPAPVATVTVAPSSASLTVGQTSQLSVTLRDASGNVLTGRTITWSSNATGVAGVSSSGLVTAVAAGGATITATSEGRTGTASVTVTAPAPPPVATVTVAPSTASLTVGQTSQLSVTLRDASNNVLTGRTVTWSSSATGVASVNSSGLVTAVAAGNATITATSEGRTGTAQFTISAPAPAPVATVTVAPSSASLTVGQTSQLSVTLRDANNNVLTGRTVTWSSNATGVASVNGSGLVTAVAAGSATITATSEGRTGTAQFTISAPAPAPVATVTVAPSSASLTVGQTSQLSVTLRDANNNVLTGRTVTWSSNATGVASVNGSGLVTAVAAGSATITATSEGRTGTAQFTISAPAPAPVATVTVAPSSASLTVGQTSQLSVTLRDANNNVLTGRTVTWSSNATGVASVNGSGLVTAVAVGNATITATSEGRTGQAQVTVSAATSGGSLAWLSDFRNGTGTIDPALHDGGKWASDLNGGGLANGEFHVVNAAGLNFPTTNVSKVSYVGLGSANFQLTTQLPVSAATVPAVGQYWFVRFYYRNDIGDGQDVGEAHWFQTHLYNSWTFKHGTPAGGRFEFRIVTDLTGNYADNKNYTLTLTRGVTYMVEMRIQRLTSTTGRISMRVSNTSGTLLYGDNDFHTFAGTWDTMAANQPVTPVDNNSFTNHDMGNNDVNRTGVGDFYAGAFAIRVSSDPNAWIGLYTSGG